MTIAGVLVNAVRGVNAPSIGASEAISELERNFRIDENIIRYLTTKAAKIPTEPSYIMKAKIEKENTENMLNETNLSSNEG